MSGISGARTVEEVLEGDGEQHEGEGGPGDEVPRGSEAGGWRRRGVPRRHRSRQPAAGEGGRQNGSKGGSERANPVQTSRTHNISERNGRDKNEGRSSTCHHHRNVHFTFALEVGRTVSRGRTDKKKSQKYAVCLKFPRMEVVTRPPPVRFSRPKG